MIDADRVLQPRREQRAAIERLETYASAEDLADALVSVRDALERSLRLLLCADDRAPDDVRLAAMSPADLPFDAVVSTVRRRDLVSMELAGRLHEVEQATARIAAGGGARPGDADAAEAALRLLSEEIAAGNRGVTAANRASAAPPVAVAADATDAGAWTSLEERGEPVEAEHRSGLPLLLGALAVLALVALAVIFLRARGAEGSRGEAIAAFDAGDYAGARAGFESALGSDSSDVTALLYLGRIHRREGRFEKAAAVLHAAAIRAPMDESVRRELGWLFLDLDRAEAAVEQFRQARQIDASDERNWIGLIRALRAAGDPRVEDVLREAPESVRRQFGATG
jgi:tetratricopeptide (TPR) repeat protein